MTRPPRPPSARREGEFGAKHAIAEESAAAAEATATTNTDSTDSTIRARKRSPSPTPRKRASSLSRTCRDHSLDAVGPAVQRLRSASPSSRPGTQERKENETAARSRGSVDDPVVVEPVDGPTRGAPHRCTLPLEALQELERLSGSENAQASTGPTLKPISAAGLSSRLRLTQQMSAKTAGLHTVGSLATGPLGLPGPANKGLTLTLRVGQASANPENGARLRAGNATAPKIAPSTLVASRLFGELKELGSSTKVAAPTPLANRSGKGPRTAMWKSEIKAASIRYDHETQQDEPQRTATASTGQAPHLPPNKDPWVALERLRLHPESAEFVYMVPYRRSDAMPLNPYHLQVVPHSKVAYKEGGVIKTRDLVYYTLSLDGVTANRPGEDPHFTPLEVWKRECFVFESLVELTVFGRYKWWKPFKVWKQNVKLSKFWMNRDALRQKALLMNPIMYSTLLALREQASLLEASSLFREEGSRNSGAREDACDGLGREGAWHGSLGEFSDMQQSQQMQFLQRLKAFWRESAARVRSGCSHVLADFEREFQEHGPKESVYAGVGAGSQSTTRGSVAPPLPFKYTRLAARRVVQQNLFNFLRLCDYMVLHALKTSVMHATARLCDRFCRRDPDAVFPPIIVAQLSMEAGDTRDTPRLVLSPSELEMKVEVEGLAASFLKTVCSSVRLLKHPDLVEFYSLCDEHDVTEMHQVLAQMVQNSVEYQQLLRSLQIGIVRAYDKAEDVMDRRKPLLQYIVKNGNFDIEQVESTVQDLDTPFEVLLELEAGFKAQMDQMQEIEEFVDCDALRIMCTGYRDQLMPSPQRCVDEIRVLMPALLARQQRRLLDQVMHGNSILNALPDNISDYMQYCSALETIDAGQGVLEAKISDSNKHRMLLQDNGMDLSAVDAVTSDILQTDLRQLQQALVVATENREANNGRFVGVLQEMLLGLERDISEIQMLADDRSFVTETNEPQVVLSAVRDLSEQIGALEERARLMKLYQRALRRPMSQFTELLDMSQAMSLKRGVWETLEEIDDVFVRSNAILLESIDKRAEDDRQQRWMQIAVRAEKELPSNSSIVGQLKQKVAEHRSLITTCSHVANPALKERHWAAVEASTGQRLGRQLATAKKDGEPLTLGLVLRLNFLEHTEVIVKTSQKASQELALEEMLAKVKGVWKELEFPVCRYGEEKDRYIFGDCDEIQACLDDSMTTIASILSNRYVAGILEEVEAFHLKLKVLQACMDEWLTLQRNWLYLKPIFSAPDIQRQLPHEYKAFEGIDHEFKVSMRLANDNPTCLRAALLPGKREALALLNQGLDKIQKTLEDYLEFKRMAFPRFYFLSNDELLEILSHIRDVQAVQTYMNSCFDGIKSLDFGGHHPDSPVSEIDPNSLDILGMISPEGEYVSLGKNLKARGEVQEWMASVERRMVEMLRVQSKEALNDYQTQPRSEWALCHSGQLIIMVSQVVWCRGVEGALRLVAAQECAAGLAQCLDSQVGHLYEQCKLAASRISALQRMRLVALITIDVHNRDVIEDLVQKQAQSADDFTWQMRLRYYWESDLGAVGDCRVRQVTAAFVYGHEYLGASSRLVITGLTDRCYVTLSGALELQLGGAPQGPAGTGKTETTKDLAKALGRQCVVFNCGENLDAVFMSKFFKGLAQCGGWACFDEFNRINIEVLSVVAQQVISIQLGLRQHLSEVEFAGRMIRLQPTFGVFITMNPGYAGRTDLPDNLKALFRPVSMMVPDYALVSEVMLFAEGFVEAKALSRKMVHLFKVSSGQLSQAKHYDFGMRAVKSVLSMAGARKRAKRKQSEAMVLVQAMCDSNVPKFSDQDLALFYEIVGDLFPDLALEADSHERLRCAVGSALAEGRLMAPVQFVDKAIQLAETASIRFGMLVLGKTGSGKTTLIYCLAASMGKMADTPSRRQGNASMQSVNVFALNPKIVNVGELYGNYSATTGEWKDGLASSIVRMANADASSDVKWICFDGPIDVVWIESMNTVLDDNRMLCLPNGERIKLNDQTLRMLFEVDNVEMASPATISRLGILNLPETSLGMLSPVLASFGDMLPGSTPDAITDSVKEMFTSVLPAAIDFVRAELREEIDSVDSNLCVSCRHIFEALVGALFASAESVETFSSDPSPLAHGSHFAAGVRDIDMLKLLQNLFSFSLAWSVGGNLDSDSREKFSEWCRKSLASGRFPRDGQVYDYFVDPRSSAFDLFSSVTAQFRYDPATPFAEIVVPTVDTTRYQYLLERLCSKKRRVLLVGPTGTGKSVIVNDNLAGMGTRQRTVSCALTFSAQSSSARLEQVLELTLERKRKGLYGAPPGKILVLFIDDVNMPRRDQFGAQPPVELARQLIDTSRHFRPGGGANPAFAGGGGFYDRQKHTWSSIEDLVMVAACAPPGGGRNQMTARFCRHLNMLYLAPPAKTVLNAICAGILGGHLAAFDQAVQLLGVAAVNATIEVYEWLLETMLPTPAKSHYTFNLRDLSKVFQGMLSITPEHCQDSRTFIYLWIHECQRVFQDRLINLADKGSFDALLLELLKRLFGVNWDAKTLFSTQKPMFCHFGNQAYNAKEAPYALVEDNAVLPRLLQTHLDAYNMTTPQVMDLVFFAEAVEHVSRLCRQLRTPSGHAMLVGLGGSGRQSLARLASFILGLSCRQADVSPGCGLVEFREDLKQLYLLTGLERRACVFLFNDTQITDEGFLEDISCILNTGEVPNLFSSEEQDQIATDIRNTLPQDQLPESNDPEGFYRRFLKQACSNLHLVLCMSPVGDALRIRLRTFPPLVNCCTIDWYLPWPKEALLDVAHRASAGGLSDNQHDGLFDALASSDRPGRAEQGAETCLGIAQVCMSVHASMGAMTEEYMKATKRRIYVTPKSFLDLLRLFQVLLRTKKTDLLDRHDKYSTGLAKMSEITGVIDQSKRDLEQLRPVLAEKAVKTEELLHQVSRDTETATQVKDQVARETRDVELQAQEVRGIQADAQKDLEAAMPAMERAIAALNSLSKGDITEVKSFAQPPALVQVVMEAVCILLGQPASWDSARRVLGQPDFMKQLLTYDKDNIDDRTITALKRFTLNPEFVPENVENVSKAAKGLCMWVRAIDVYAGVAKEVEPKRFRLKQADEALQAAQISLAAKQAELEVVVEKVTRLEAQLAHARADQKKLQDEADLCEARVARAAKLTSALGEEQIEWARILTTIDEQLSTIVGDVILSSACVTYFGSFDEEYRRRFVRQAHASCIKHGLEVSDSFSLRSVLASEVSIRGWCIHGLPSDPQSIDSAVIAMNAHRWPLLIDPQAQANKWIRGMLEPLGLRVLRPNDANFVRILETSVRNGTSLLLEDVGEKLNSALRPLLAKQVFRQDDRLLIKIKDAEVDYDRDFRLFMTTALRNPHYLPDVSIETTLIDFTVTVKALEEQLLGTLVRNERPELENHKDKLVISMASDKRQLQDLQDKVLQKLKESQGVILDNEPLVAALQQSNNTSSMISRRFEEAAHTDADLSALREGYRGVAERAAVMYFVIDSLAALNPMYQYSLAFFKATYNYCIQTSGKSEANPAADARTEGGLAEPEGGGEKVASQQSGGAGGRGDDRPSTAVLSVRLEELLKAVTEHTFQIVCRGLFEADKALFSILVCIAIERAAGHLEDAEWSFVLRGARVSSRVQSGGGVGDPRVSFLSAKKWAQCEALQEVFEYSFEGLTASIAARPSAWMKWISAAAPHKTPPPAPYAKLHGTFQAVMLIRVLREESVALALRAFVALKMGPAFSELPVVQLCHVFPDTNCTTPIVFLLSSGCDPTAMLFQFAQDMGKAEGMLRVSLGQGQGLLAQRLVDTASKKGEWVCLMNCHLAASWMPELERIVSAMAAGSTPPSHAEFRLWLTSKPSAAFPIAVLQASQKITDEAPKGIRANMMGSLRQMATQAGWGQGAKANTWHKILFSLMLFHAIVQERCKFGPLGWNVKYEFSSSDFSCAKDMLHLFIEKFETVQWDALLFLTGEIIYGGRVTDEQDRRRLMSILQQHYRPDVLAVDKFELTASASYLVPLPGSFEDMARHVSELPQDDDADVFSMHSNANIALQRQVLAVLCVDPLANARQLPPLVSVVPLRFCRAPGG